MHCDYCGKEEPFLWNGTLPIGNYDDTSPFISFNARIEEFSAMRFRWTLCDDCYSIVEKRMRRFQRHSLLGQAIEYIKFCKFAAKYNGDANTISERVCDK